MVIVRDKSIFFEILQKSWGFFQESDTTLIHTNEPNEPNEPIKRMIKKQPIWEKINKRKMNLHKPSFHDFKFMMNLLDNPDSYIHHKTFRSLKETIIKNLTTKFWIDDFGDIYHSKEF